MSEIVSPPDATADAFTRIWHRADASHGQYVQAIAELRERKRREQEAPQLSRGRWSRIRLLAGEPLPPPHHEEQEMPLALPARAGWFVLRMGAYGLIGLAVFAFVAWVSVR